MGTPQKTAVKPEAWAEFGTKNTLNRQQDCLPRNWYLVDRNSIQHF